MEFDSFSAISCGLVKLLDLEICLCSVGEDYRVPIKLQDSTGVVLDCPAPLTLGETGIAQGFKLFAVTKKTRS